MKLAIVHEWLNVYGGSERLLAEILDLYPQAEVYALIHNKQNLINTLLEKQMVTTSFMQKIPHVEHLYRGLLPLMPLAIQSLNVRNYDMVISLSHAVAHGVITTKSQKHISYISTPMRYAWHMQNDYLRLHRLNRPIIKLAARLILSLLRRWDVIASRRSDSFIANSQWTAGHIHEAWGRNSEVIYPPVNVERFSPANDRQEFYIHVSRLVPYKMTAVIIAAFNKLKLPLVIIGDGPEILRLRKLANENIKLMGFQSDEIVANMLSRAKGFVYMAIEDFGIAMVEAQAAGCPVIAYRKGGAAEIVWDGETGLLFEEQTAESMIEAVLQSQNKKLRMRLAFHQKDFELNFLLT